MAGRGSRPRRARARASGSTPMCPRPGARHDASASIATRISARASAATTASTRSSCAMSSTMSVTRAAARSSAASAAMRRAVGARVPQHDVFVRLGEPQRLGQREREDAAVPGQRERRVDDLAHADRLARDADRHAARPHEPCRGRCSAARPGSMAATGPETSATAAVMRRPVLGRAASTGRPGTVRVPPAGRGS